MTFKLLFVRKKAQHNGWAFEVSRKGS